MLDQRYLPEPFTFVTALAFVILLACVNYLVIWLQNRRETALLWMAGGAFLSCAGLYAGALLPNPSAGLVAGPAVLFGTGCIWTGCRVVVGRRPLWPALAAAAVAWPAFATPTGLLDNPRPRAAFVYTIGAILLFLALREVLSKGWPRRPGHWFVTILLSLEGAVCLFWAMEQAMTVVSGSTFGDAINAPFSAFTVTGFHLLMSYAFVALAKEELELAHAADAYRDPLTGIGNRRPLDRHLAEAVSQARRGRYMLAVIMIDIDHFKAYNDHYGHPAGDACLVAVARCLTDSITPPGHEATRYGGEEFTVLLRRAEAATAYDLAERMRLAVRGMNRPHEGWAGGIVTISLGVAAMPGETATPETLIAAADRALYRAKKSGRDRAALFTPEDAAIHPLNAGRIRVSEGLPADAGSSSMKI